MRNCHCQKSSFVITVHRHHSSSLVQSILIAKHLSALVSGPASALGLGLSIIVLGLLGRLWFTGLGRLGCPDEFARTQRLSPRQNDHSLFILFD